MKPAYLFRNAAVVLLLTCLLCPARAQQIGITRLNGGEPIIHRAMFDAKGYAPEDGGNINGPCLIRLPDWLPRDKRVDPRAEYYLYFAHHHGKYIRLAWAERPAGPWTLAYNEAMFGESPQDAVLAMEPHEGTGKRIYLTDSLSIRNHIASPIVIVDDANKRFKLYFHGPTYREGVKKSLGQKTFFAASPDGLRFNGRIAPYILGISYFSPFEYEGRPYALTHTSLCIAPAGGETAAPGGFDTQESLWTTGEPFFDEAIRTYCTASGIDMVFNVRHVGQFIDGATMHIFFSPRMDKPERIYYAKADLSGKDPRRWKAAGIQLVMRAEKEWEGAGQEPTRSLGGSAKGFLNEVRDPFVFRDRDGKLYLLYCAGGERAIGIAALTIAE